VVVSVCFDNLSSIRSVEVKTAFPNVESIQIATVPKHCLQKIKKMKIQLFDLLSVGHI